MHSALQYLAVVVAADHALAKELLQQRFWQRCLVLEPLQGRGVGLLRRGCHVDGWCGVPSLQPSCEHCAHVMFNGMMRYLKRTHLDTPQQHRHCCYYSIF